MPNKQIDVTVDQRGMSQPPVDPSVTIPASVKAASKAADAIHAQAYAPNPDAAPPATVPVEDALPAAPEPKPAPVTAAVRPNPNAPKGSPEFEAHVEASMKGRWEDAQRQLGIAQSQLREMGSELMQTQALLQQTVKATPVTPPAPAAKRLTEKDVETYGSELLEVVQRAAEDAVAPKLTQLEQENLRLQRRLQQTNAQSASQMVHAALTAWRPDWEAINKSPQFVAWLRLPDFYSGVIRHTLLKDAFDRGQASRVLHFFQGFLSENPETGSTEQLPPAPGAGEQPPPQRQPAVALNTLAAPGRAKPPSGGSNATSTAEKPVITRAQISRFYNDSRRGVYEGRIEEYNRLQEMIFAAQREGRVR